MGYLNENIEKIRNTELNPAHTKNYDEAKKQYELYHGKNCDENSYVQFCYKFEKYMMTVAFSCEEIQTTDILSKIVEFSLINKVVCYITFAKYKSPYNRKEKNAKEFQVYIIDFDFYENDKYKGWTPEEVLNELKPKLEKYHYSAAFSSGRGLYVAFIFDVPISCTTKRVRERHKKRVQGILDEFAEYGADTKCKDFARVFKLAGTLHPKTGNIAHFIEDTKERIDYNEFIKSLPRVKSEIKKKKTKKKILKKKETVHLNKLEQAQLNAYKLFQQAKKEGLYPYRYSFESFKKDMEKMLTFTKCENLVYYPNYLEDVLESFMKNFILDEEITTTWLLELLECPPEVQSKAFYESIDCYQLLNHGRMKDIRHLVELRNGNIEYRNNLLLAYGVQAWFACPKESEVLKVMKYLNKSFKDPYVEKEVERLAKEVCKNKEYVKKGHFHLVYFPFTSERFIETFKVTKTELKELDFWNPKHILGGNYAKNARRTVERNRKAALKSRKAKHMETLLKTKSVQEVASLHGCCVATVYNTIKKSPKQEQIQQEKIALQKLRGLKVEKKQRAKVLGKSRSTFYRREKNLEEISVSNEKTKVNFIEEIYEKCSEKNYEKEIVRYIKDNFSDFTKMKKKFECILEKGNGKTKNVNHFMYGYSTILWLTSFRIPSRIRLEEYFWNSIRSSNELLETPLSRGECMEYYVLMLENKYYFEHKKYDCLHILNF